MKKSKKQHTKPRRTKITFACPRCGMRKSVTASQASHMVVCPQCGSGMREI